MNTAEFKQKLRLEIGKLELRAAANPKEKRAIDDQVLSKKFMLKRLDQFGNYRSIEYRSFPVSSGMTARSSVSTAQGHYLTGRPIVFNQRTNLGWFDEIIDSKALNAADMKDARFLVNHDQAMIPLARNGSTMSMKIDSTGLNVTVNLDTENNPTAKSLYSAVHRGDIDGMSFAFVVDKDAWEKTDTDHPTRRILSIMKVAEVSAVTYPAYKETSIQIMKGVK